MAEATVLYPSTDGVRYVIEYMFKNEYQFRIEWATKRSVLVSFHKGDWVIHDEQTGEQVRVCDSTEVTYAYSPLVWGFLKQRIEAHSADYQDQLEGLFRTVPALAMCDYLELKYGKLDNFTATVLKPERNGYIDADGNFDY